MVSEQKTGLLAGLPHPLARYLLPVVVGFGGFAGGHTLKRLDSAEKQPRSPLVINGHVGRYTGNSGSGRRQNADWVPHCDAETVLLRYCRGSHETGHARVGQPLCTAIGPPPASLQRLSSLPCLASSSLITIEHLPHSLTKNHTEPGQISEHAPDAPVLWRSVSFQGTRSSSSPSRNRHQQRQRQVIRRVLHLFLRMHIPYACVKCCSPLPYLACRLRWSYSVEMCPLAQLLPLRLPLSEQLIIPRRLGRQTDPVPQLSCSLLQYSMQLPLLIPRGGSTLNPTSSQSMFVTSIFTGKSRTFLIMLSRSSWRGY